VIFHCPRPNTSRPNLHSPLSVDARICVECQLNPQDTLPFDSPLLEPGFLGMAYLCACLMLQIPRIHLEADMIVRVNHLMRHCVLQPFPIAYLIRTYQNAIVRVKATALRRRTPATPDVRAVDIRIFAQAANLSTEEGDCRACNTILRKMYPKQRGCADSLFSNSQSRFFSHLLQSLSSLMTSRACIYFCLSSDVMLPDSALNHVCQV
jgi:hypothetical protein